MKVHLIHFSPGGTTKETLHNISKGFPNAEIVEIDMLKKSNREKRWSFNRNDLVILGMMTLVQPFGPVKQIFNAIKGNSTPLVGVVLFGNGMYGNSLKVMKKEVEKKGFNMIAAGAFIGKMSYDTEVGKNRPDALDKKIQIDFGKGIWHKISSKSDLSLREKIKTDWPQKSLFHKVKTAICIYLPVGKFKVPKPFNSLEFTESCIECGACENRCPMGAINLKEKYSNPKFCIGCLACVNGCKNNGIIYTNKLMQKAAFDCRKHFAARREPVVYF